MADSSIPAALYLAAQSDAAMTDLRSSAKALITQFGPTQASHGDANAQFDSGLDYVYTGTVSTALWLASTKKTCLAALEKSAATLVKKYSKETPIPDDLGFAQMSWGADQVYTYTDPGFAG